jgi:hypothetical protein
MKKLLIKTNTGEKTYSLPPSGGGFDVHRTKASLFGSSKTFVGHGGSLSDAVLVARVDADDSTVKSVKLSG